MANIIIPAGSGRFTVSNYALHNLTQAEQFSFFSEGSVMGFAFEHMVASQYRNITGVRVSGQKKDVVIVDPDDDTLSQHWEAKGFKTSQCVFAGKTSVKASSIKASIVASCEEGGCRQLNAEKSADKYAALCGFIFHIPGTFPEIYHYQLPVDVVRHHRQFGGAMCLATVLGELRHLGVTPKTPERIRNVPINYNQPFHSGRFSWELNPIIREPMPIAPKVLRPTGEVVRTEQHR